MPTTSRDSAGVIFPPPLIYVAPLLVGLWLHARLPLPFWRLRGRSFLGGSLLGAGFTIAFLAIRTMGRAHTPLNPTQPVTTLVVEGPFQVTRNPVYLALTLIYTGIALLANTLWPLLLLPVILRIMNREVIGREEQYLEQKFGEQYLSYKQKVRRWL